MTIRQLRKCSILFCWLGLHALAANAQSLGVLASQLFDDTSMLRFSLVGNVQDLFSNRAGEAVEYDFSIIEPETNLEHSLKISTRGHYRRLPGNCRFPPLLLDFPKDRISSSSIFYKQNKLKLVLPCQGEQYIFREYLTYRLFNLLSIASFKVRLVEITFVERQRKNEVITAIGFLIEDEEALSERNNAIKVEEDHISPKTISPENFIQVAIFQFMIGNTDWSVQYRQNIKILQHENENTLLIVPYDFDHSGLVKAPYARPATALRLSSVTQRRYRGYCADDLDIYPPYIDSFLSKESDLLQLINDFTYLDKSSRKHCIKFIEGFYIAIKDEKKWKKAFDYPCKKGGTGNVVIKGLRE